jgi:hypothetical protein
MTDAMEVPMCACGDAWHEHNAANHAPTCRVLAAFATLTRERDEARKERENVSSQLWDCMNEREGLRAKLDEARVVTDAMVERAAKAMWEGADGLLGMWSKASEQSREHYHDLARRALTAALSEATP